MLKNQLRFVDLILNDMDESKRRRDNVDEFIARRLTLQ